MEEESTDGMTEGSMRDNINMTKSTVMGSTLGLMGANTMEAGPTASGMGEGNTFLKMAASGRESGSTTRG